ncbi:MAG: hypothetical protein GWM98_19330, partial [Nitrospinaceae bacterium]|nr:hypothetical protein [Nitrospinaceae bacterium]NIR56241.1 hypothetical protein [Nitrospinaceae bacterium]NIS86697.1 hypothetical protein [Nitrospinaceae bacterium]NIT83530.1 hypothetical protein [Nitrospinaceae bacterium]NIU45735.1 hypothetical protein [Nitrospinaceae bacterium]
FLIALWTGGAATALAQNPDLKEALKLDRQGFFAESIGFWKKFLQSQPQENLHVYAQIKLTIA